MIKPVIVLVGKLGHGKTHLLNKLTGQNFPSNIGAMSCTQVMQYGYSRKNGILVIDTPGFCASDDVAAHIAAQKLALEGTKLSGVYVVVKYGRADEIAEMVEKVMNFIGDDDLRIIVTWSDTVCNEKGYDAQAMKRTMANLLSVPVSHIIIVGKRTSSEIIETFIQTTLHEAREYTISAEQITIISSLCAGARRFNKRIEEVYAKVSASSVACRDLMQYERSIETDTAIVTIQNVTTKMVQDAKDSIFRDAEALPTEQQNLIYGKAGLALSLRLKTFMDTSNKLLSWDVTNPSDPRNTYKRCNYCGAIFNKTEGCDGETICGAVPSKVKNPRALLTAEFAPYETGWVVQYNWSGLLTTVKCVMERLQQFFLQGRQTLSSGIIHTKCENSVIESGCGASIAWNTMLPVDEELVKTLGEIEIEPIGCFERCSKSSFDDSLRKHEATNKRVLEKALTRN